MKKILLNFGDWNYNVHRQVENTYGGVGLYRLIKPGEQIAKIPGYEVTVWGQEIKKAGKYSKMKKGSELEKQWDGVFTEFDVYWTSYFASAEAAAAIFFNRDKHGKTVVIDIDDNYFDILKTNPLYDEFGPGKQKRAFMSAILSFADIVTVSTEPLKKRVEDHILQVQGIEKEVVVIPNMNDIKDWHFVPKKRNPGKVVIGYSGSNSHQEDLLMVMPAIKTVMEKNPHVSFQCLGAMDSKYIPTYFKGFSDELLKRCDIVASTPTFREYPPWLAAQGWDIGIAPLADSPFTVSKSCIKYFEYAMFKIPTIASRVYPYYMPLMGREVITDGETGLLAKPKDWVKLLSKLVENPQERERLGQNAYDHVKKTWQYDDGPIREIVKGFLG